MTSYGAAQNSFPWPLVCRCGSRRGCLALLSASTEELFFSCVTDREEALRDDGVFRGTFAVEWNTYHLHLSAKGLCVALQINMELEEVPNTNCLNKFQQLAVVPRTHMRVAKKRRVAVDFRILQYAR